MKATWNNNTCRSYMMKYSIQNNKNYIYLSSTKKFLKNQNQFFALFVYFCQSFTNNEFRLMPSCLWLLRLKSHNLNSCIDIELRALVCVVMRWRLMTSLIAHHHLQKYLLPKIYWVIQTKNRYIHNMQKLKESTEIYLLEITPYKGLCVVFSMLT